MKLDLPTPFFIHRLCVIGIGLIGGSLAAACRAAGVVGTVVAYDQNTASAEQAVALGIADEACTDLVAAVSDADIIIIATPITAIAAIVKDILGSIKDSAIISDVGSTKGYVVESIQATLGFLPVRFVPAHPIAGTEKQGVEHAFATLFQQRRILITPHIENSHEAVMTIQKMWQAVGGIVEEMGILHHDQVLAATSHLPHLLAFSTVDTLANLDDRAEIFRFAAGGFRDFTRISTSDPQMWTDICLLNRHSLLQVLNAYQRKLSLLETALETEDSATIYQIFRRAKHARDNFYHEP